MINPNNWNGKLFISTNIEEAKLIQNTNNNIILIIIDDDPSKYFIADNITGQIGLPPKMNVMSVLLPPYAAIDHFINGKFDIAFMAYDEFLHMDPAVQKCLSAIFTLLFSNIDVMLYVPPDDDLAVSFFNVLIQYLENMYGIITSKLSDRTKQFHCLTNIDINRYASLVDLMYTNGDITFDLYCLNYPIEYVGQSSLVTYNVAEKLNMVPNDFNVLNKAVYDFIINRKQILMNPNNNINNITPINVY